MSINIQNWHLLKHPFYRAWEDGSLSKDTLKVYAKEYLHHVSAFPRYLSSLHSQIEELPTRQIILENLVDEEQGENNHPKLWLDFCLALGWNADEVRSTAAGKGIQNVMDTFFWLARKSAASGLGALYAYESQIPEIAEFKLKALKDFYVEENRHEDLRFFEVHRVADKYHRAALEEVFSRMSDEEKKEAQEGAEEAAKALWAFLDEMNDLEMAA